MVTKYLRKQLKEGRIYFDSWFPSLDSWLDGSGSVHGEAQHNGREKWITSWWTEGRKTKTGGAKEQRYTLALQ
jgi:hypothetical protein